MYFRNDIQSLRGVAVIFVFFYHLYPKIICGGFIGVDIFFVISGFLVCNSIECRISKNSNKYYISFYAARIRRLLPSSIATIVSISLYILKYNFKYFIQYKNDAIACLFFYSNYKFYFDKIDYFRGSLDQTPLLHYWSLSLEEQFYIFIPVFIRLFNNHILDLYIILLVLSFIVSFIYCFSNKNKGYFFLSSRSWEFIVGALIKYLKSYKINSSIFYSNIAVILLIILSMYYNDNIVYPSYNAIIPLFLVSYIIQYSCCNLITNKTFIVLGNLSYPIYLSHYPLLILLNSVKFSYYILLILFVLILHYYVEIPFYKGCFYMPDKLTIIVFIAFLIFLHYSILRIDYKINNIIKHTKHYSSYELIKEIERKLALYCCIKIQAKLIKSPLLFIGDSHIEQYIIALFDRVNNFKYQLIHIYIPSLFYNNTIVKDSIQRDLKHFYFQLCLIGNYIYKDFIYLYIYDIAKIITSMCNKVLINNDNPFHYKDPNSCYNINMNDCYGIFNISCNLPRHFKKFDNNVDIITLWNEKIILNNKCLYYINQVPIYADKNHFSIFYLRYNYNNNLYN